MAAVKRILVLDDEHAILKLLSFYLAQQGWEVVAVSSATAAIEAFAAGRFDMLLADVDLGDGMDGIEVARRLLEREPPLKVVIMSAIAGNAAKVREANVGGFLTKPFDFSQLGAMLRLHRES
jgi:DNA-binding response OmpR family regulator